MTRTSSGALRDSSLSPVACKPLNSDSSDAPSRSLMTSSALFWASYEQAGSSLSLFAENNTGRHLPFGLLFPASWYQTVQPIFVVALAPVFAWFWLMLARRRKEPSSPAKFTLALVFAGLALPSWCRRR